MPTASSQGGPGDVARGHGIESFQLRARQAEDGREDPQAVPSQGPQGHAGVLDQERAQGDGLRKRHAGAHREVRPCEERPHRHHRHKLPRRRMAVDRRDLGHRTYYPVRPGYASTILKFQGAGLNHVTVYLDAPGVPGAAYTAASRVKTGKDVLFGGALTREHFTPAR